VKWYLAMILLMGVVGAASITWVVQDMTRQTEAAPEQVSTQSPTVVTISHPTGSITCVVLDRSIDCMPTWWMVPPWVDRAKAVELYNEGSRRGD